MATFGNALICLETNYRAGNLTLELTRNKPDREGNPAWRRAIGRDASGIYERWPSGFTGPYHPSQEDMLATDWEIVEK